MWQRLATGWGWVGGPADMIAGGPNQLLASDSLTGQPRVFLGAPGSWAALAVLLGHPVPPFAPGGTFVYGLSSLNGGVLYYAPPGMGEAWGLRSPALRPPGSTVYLSEWYRLETFDTLQIVTRAPTPSHQDDLVLVTTGWSMSVFTWPEIDADTTARMDGHATVGVDGEESWYLVNNWIGRLGVTVYAGTLPPGVNVDVAPDGLIRWHGTPTAVGTWSFQLVLTDSSGSSALTGGSITVHRPTDFPGYHVPVPLNGWRSVTYSNCFWNGWPMHVWIRDYTTGEAWHEAAVVPPQHVFDPVTGDVVGCTPTPASALIHPPAGHLVEVVATDGAWEWCSFTNDPDNFGCLQFHHRFTSEPSATDDNILVSEPRPSWMH